MNLLLLLALLGQALAGTLTVTILDIGQGDSILIQSPAGKTVLIDAGDVNSNVVTLLRARGIEKFDMVLATHPHADHIGSMPDVLREFPVRFYIDQGAPHTTQVYEKTMLEVEKHQIAYKAGRAGQTFNLDDGIRIELLHPQDRPLSNTRSDLNANSVVARLTHGDNCFLFVGDAEEDTERVLLQKGIEPCQVLKVAHHGSQYSSTDAFLRAVKPELALISTGEKNRYGHPTPEAMERLKSVGAQIYRTDRDGSIVVRSDGKRLKVETEKSIQVLSSNSDSPSEKQVEAPARAASPVLVSMSEEPPAEKAPPRLASRKEDAPAPAPADECSGVDVNSANAHTLEGLPGIGPSKAEAIEKWREEHGRYDKLADLDAVPGIGPSTLEGLAGQVCFGGAPNSEQKGNKK